MPRSSSELFNLLSALLITMAPRAATSRIDSESQPSLITDFYCENAYTNFAAGYIHSGTYVDSDGRVFTFNSRRMWLTPRNGPVRQEVEAKYGERQQVSMVLPQRLDEVRRLLADARSGSLSEKVSKGADMGRRASGCWIREAGSETYRMIELEVDGDWSYKNTSASAAELARWLTALTKERQ